ncbi:uncharacterized protein LOC121598001 [Anopheles merus]|uniref:uncharacterized protein LOC121598001 n=1 Tax=Anopheles merus TaxID=30066 RepID=UPI001BE48D80|nr:uncharacterized protein LOC121598001 [Anopheles merus]
MGPSPKHLNLWDDSCVREKEEAERSGRLPVSAGRALQKSDIAKTGTGEIPHHARTHPETGRQRRGRWYASALLYWQSIRHHRRPGERNLIALLRRENSHDESSSGQAPQRYTIVYLDKTIRDDWLKRERVKDKKVT